MSGMNEQQQRALADGMKALAATTRHAGASARVEAAVMAEWARVSGLSEARPPAAGRFAWRAIAAALILASSSGVWLSQRYGVTVNSSRQSDFLEIPGAAYLPPLESAAIVRVALPVSSLPSYGIYIGDAATDAVEADLLIAQDGLARGIRLVNNSQSSRSTP